MGLQLLKLEVVMAPVGDYFTSLNLLHSYFINYRRYSRLHSFKKSKYERLYICKKI